MNILKAAVLCCLISGAVLTGCSNESVSPISSQGTPEESIVNEKQSPDKEVQTSIRVKPFRTYTLDYSNTGLKLFRALKSSNCKDVSDKVEITGYGNEKVQISACGSKFQVTSIVVQNLTSEFIDMDLTLFGEK